MEKLLSAQLGEAIAAIDHTPEPSREQLLEMRVAHRQHLVNLVEFAETAEGAHRSVSGAVPLWGTAAACAQLYRRLCRTSDGTMAGPVVVSIARFMRITA